MEIKGRLASELPTPPLRKQIVAHIVVPGEDICDATGVMRGHGTYLHEGRLVASIAGVVERVNKFVTVRPLRSRYTGDVGDVVIGRITSVQQKRWKVDLHAKQEGILLLSSINLPGDVRRRRTLQDQLQMRNFFQEGDLISAEVQQFFHDGAMSLHTRHKYGKLEHGTLIQVPPNLIKRSKTHFRTLNCGVDMIIGTNGFIWISPVGASPNPNTPVVDAMEVDTDSPQTKKTVEASPEMRQNMARVRNSIAVLATLGLAIHPTTISHVFHRSVELGLEPKALLEPDAMIAVSDVPILTDNVD